jgi:hypothetical protein
MKEYFSQQLNQNKVVTQDALDRLITNKTYSSGREIKLGETVLFAFIKEEPNTISMISLHEDELDQYEFVQSPNQFIPTVKLK